MTFPQSYTFNFPPAYLPYGGYGYTYTYTYTPPQVKKEEPEQATVFDLPGWNTALTVKGMLDRPGSVGYACLNNSWNPILAVDAYGKLYIHAASGLKPSLNCHSDWEVQVSSRQDVKDGPVTLDVYVAEPAMNNIGVLKEDVIVIGMYPREEFLPVARVLTAPLK